MTGPVPPKSGCGPRLVPAAGVQASEVRPPGCTPMWAGRGHIPSTPGRFGSRGPGRLGAPEAGAHLLEPLRGAAQVSSPPVPRTQLPTSITQFGETRPRRGSSPGNTLPPEQRRTQEKKHELISLSPQKILSVTRGSPSHLWGGRGMPRLLKATAEWQGRGGTQGVTVPAPCGTRCSGTLGPTLAVPDSTPPPQASLPCLGQRPSGAPLSRGPTPRPGVWGF